MIVLAHLNCNYFDPMFVVIKCLNAFLMIFIEQTQGQNSVIYHMFHRNIPAMILSETLALAPKLCTGPLVGSLKRISYQRLGTREFIKQITMDHPDLHALIKISIFNQNFTFITIKSFLSGFAASFTVLYLEI